MSRHGVAYAAYSLLQDFDSIRRQMPGMPTPTIAIRTIQDGDSIPELTALLHRAYGPLAERGMRFVASHQDELTTRQRIEKGTCYLAFEGDVLVGTINLYAPRVSRGSPWLDRADVASCGQFAVEPACQRRGMGSRLLAHVEDVARRNGAAELALDTAEPAMDLIRFYGARGYRFIEYVQWTSVNYRSVVLSKRMVPEGEPT